MEQNNQLLSLDILITKYNGSLHTTADRKPTFIGLGMTFHKNTSQLTNTKLTTFVLYEIGPLTYEPLGCYSIMTFFFSLLHSKWLS